MEWCMGCKRWTEVVSSSSNALSYFVPYLLLVSNNITGLFRYVALLVISIGCYLVAFAFSGILFIWFNPSGHDCGLNVFFIVMTMILAFAFAIIALHPSVGIGSCSLWINASWNQCPDSCLISQLVAIGFGSSMQTIVYVLRFLNDYSYI